MLLISVKLVTLLPDFQSRERPPPHRSRQSPRPCGCTGSGARLSFYDHSPCQQDGT